MDDDAQLVAQPTAAPAGDPVVREPEAAHPAQAAVPDADLNPNSVPRPSQAETDAPADESEAVQPGLDPPATGIDASPEAAQQKQEHPEAVVGGVTSAASQPPPPPSEPTNNPTSDAGETAINPNDHDNKHSATAATTTSGGSGIFDPPTTSTGAPAPGPTPEAAPAAFVPPDQATDTAEPPVPRFVAPSSYLRPKSSLRSSVAPEPAMATPQPPPALGPYDKEQLQGLVSFGPPRLARRVPKTTRHGPLRPFCVLRPACGRSSVLTMSAESDSRFPQGPHELRCPATFLPLDRPRHKSAHQEEP